MADEKCQPFRDLLPAYALQALDPDEFESLEKHLRACAGCRAELEKCQAMSDGLLFAMPKVVPPARVRARLIARLAAEKPHAARHVRFNWQWVMGLALVALLVLNVSTLVQLDFLQRQQAALTAQLNTSQKALALVAYPDSRTYEVSGKAAGTLVLNDELHSGALFIWGLEPLDPMHTYQVWLIQPDGKRVSGGLFRPEPGQLLVSAFVSSPRPFSDFVGLGVTVEPSGGSPAPTTPRVIGTTF